MLKEILVLAVVAIAVVSGLVIAYGDFGGGTRVEVAGSAGHGGLFQDFEFAIVGYFPGGEPYYTIITLYPDPGLFEISPAGFFDPWNSGDIRIEGTLWSLHTGEMYTTEHNIGGVNTWAGETKPFVLNFRHVKGSGFTYELKLEIWEVGGWFSSDELKATMRFHDIIVPVVE